MPERERAAERGDARLPTELARCKNCTRCTAHPLKHSFSAPLDKCKNRAWVGSGEGSWVVAPSSSERAAAELDGAAFCSGDCLFSYLFTKDLLNPKELDTALHFFRRFDSLPTAARGSASAVLGSAADPGAPLDSLYSPARAVGLGAAAGLGASAAYREPFLPSASVLGVALSDAGGGAHGLGGLSLTSTHRCAAATGSCRGFGIGASGLGRPTLLTGGGAGAGTQPPPGAVLGCGGGLSPLGWPACLVGGSGRSTSPMLLDGSLNAALQALDATGFDPFRGQGPFLPSQQGFAGGGSGRRGGGGSGNAVARAGRTLSLEANLALERMRE